MNNTKIKTVIILLTFTGFAALGQNEQDSILEKNCDILQSYLYKLKSDYVYKINFDKLVHNGIDAMNKSLDPYTVFSNEEEIVARNNGWKGYLFSGIGAQVGVRDSLVNILGFYKFSPAHKAGLRIGDQILAVDSFRATGKSLEEIVPKLKGVEGTSVNVTVNRPGVGTIMIPVIRQKIFIESVNYYGMINDSVGYIKISQFLENSYDTMKVALKALKQHPKFAYLILDMRENIGGLLQDAVNTANLFLPKGKLICRLKSENDTTQKYDYFSLYEPVDTLVKIITLSSASTVSAGEVMIGALQDYDRVVVMGQRTFGKGHVQGTRQLVHNSELYLTAAKYYTPSGRCIQEIDYSQQHIDGSLRKFSDTLEYYTSHHRKLKASSGVEPDVMTIPAKVLPEILQMLLYNHVIGDYATLYRNTHEDLPDIKTFLLSTKDFNAFCKQAEKELSSLKNKSENELDYLISLFKDQSYSFKYEKQFHKIRKKINKEKKMQFRKNKALVKNAVEKEIISRYFFSDGKIFYTILRDDEIQDIMDLFKNSYDKILDAVN